MNRSENAGCSWSVRVISCLGMLSAVVGTTASAVPMRTCCPARHPSPKKSPGPSIATTASFPVKERTELHAASLHVEHAVRLVPLCEHEGAAGKADDPPGDGGRLEKRMQIEGKRRPGSPLLHGHDVSWHKARLDKRGCA